jgi:hypothetical protein
MSRPGIRACMVSIAIAALLAPSAIAAPPAADEYTLRLPDARGEKNLGPNPPRAQARDLPAPVRDELQGSGERKALANIATADALGAPPPSPPALNEDSGLDEDSTDGRSLPAAALSTLSDPLGLGILLALAAIAGAAFAIRRRAGGDTGQTS